MSYLISLNPMLFKNMAHVGSFKHFVFVYLRIFVFYILYKGMSYSISLNPMLFKNIAHVGSFHFHFHFHFRIWRIWKIWKSGCCCWVCNRPWSTLELLTELTNQIILRYLDNYGCWTKTLKGAFLFAIKLLVSNKIKALIYSKMNIVHL